MSEALIITLRETLEAALVVGILLAYLNKTLNFKHRKYIWWGVGAGVALSVVLAFVFQSFFGGFEGKTEELYEGVTMIVAAGLLTWMILWMLRQRKAIKKNLEDKAQMHIEKDHYWGLFWLTFVGVAREGIETVIFLQAAVVNSSGIGVLSGAVLGIVLALVMAYILFKGIVRVPLKAFFTFTGVLLILFAAGLFAHGIHEFQEAGVLPIYIEHLWDVNSVIDEKGSFGSIMKGLFGYNGNPSLLEAGGYVLYLVLISLAWWKIESKNS